MAGPGRSASTYLFEGLKARADFAAPRPKEAAWYRSPRRLVRACRALPPGTVLLDAPNRAWRDARLARVRALELRGCRAAVVVLVLVRDHTEHARSLTQSWGAAPSGGMDALLSRETLAGFAANDNGGDTGRFEAASRLQGELGYGVAAFGGGFTGTPNVGFGLSDTGRDYRLGWRLTSAVPGDPGFEVNLDATRSEAANGNEPPGHGLMLRGTIRW